MQLKIKRDTIEKKGLFGTRTRYILKARAEMTPEEEKLARQAWWSIQYLGLGRAFVERDNDRFRSSDEARSLPCFRLNERYAHDLIKGITLEDDDLNELNRAEECITNACKAIKNRVAKETNFSGTETVIEL